MSELQTTQETPVQTLPANTELKGNVKILKDAFPDLEVDLIETILDSQGDNLDSAFEILLGMSDPSYKPEPTNDQLREDEEYARRLARESQPRQNTTQERHEEQGPLFNFQEELPIIKEKVIEAGTAAKNKIVNLYNQFMAPPNDSQQASNSNRSNNDLLETRMGGLSLMDSEPQRRSPNNAPVDLYEWDGRVSHNTTPEKKTNTSTPQDQLLSDEEFARRLAREEAELATAAATANNQSNTHIEEPLQRNEEEVTFSAVDSKVDEKPATGYSIRDDDGSDNLDDLFEKKTEKVNDAEHKKET